MNDSSEKTTRKIYKIKDLPIFDTYFYVLTHWKPFWTMLRYLRIVILNFFLLQFTVKWGWRKIEIINVDHELDNEIPFEPSLVNIYLDFINFWIRPLTLIIRTLGKRSGPYVNEFLRIIGDTYYQASVFYKYKMTTTNRPTNKDYRDKQFDAIRRLDPHYLCVPSLHIAVVVLVYSYFRDLFEKEGFSQEEKDAYNKELYEGAIEIGETVLYVKQHSVNCIPAAVYMMTDATPSIFSIEDAVQFLDDLFVNQSNISETAKKDINAHLHRLFEQLLLEGQYSDYWLEPLKRWLHKYKSGAYDV